MRRAIVFATLLAAPLIFAAGRTCHAATLVLRDLRGRAVRLDDYKGKVVLLNFRATWCPPCRAEIPALIKLQRRYRSKGLQVIGITYPPERVGEIRRFIRKLGVDYPILTSTEATKALFDQSETLPVTIVIDRRGNARERVEGILIPEEFDQKIKPLLR